MIVAVVGHGPSPAGRGWGARIDACDCVIRMWDCHWQDAADYGTRYDVGCFTLSPKEIVDFRRLLRRRPASWWAYDPRGMIHACHVESLPEPVVAIDPSAWEVKGRRMGGIGLSGRFELSRGSAAALAALEWLKPEWLHLVGFDTVASGTIAQTEYGPAAAASNALRQVTPQHKIDRARGKTASHDYQAERRLILAAAGDRIEWGFA